MSELAQGFSGSRSINGSQETSCIKRKGFLLFLSYDQPQKYTDEVPVLWRTAFQAAFVVVCHESEGAAPGYS